MAERMAIHRIIRGSGATRQEIMPGHVFKLTDAEAVALDAQFSTADPRQPRERGDGDTTVIERVAEPVTDMVRETELPADPVAGKSAGKDGATTRAQPLTVDEEEGEL